MRRLLLFGALLGIGMAADPIVKHPRELHFPQRDFMPPAAADYRHKLSNGAMAFLVEDHELPLINISLLIHTGDYLDPAGKTGLAQLMGSQMRSGGTQSRTPESFDEDAAFLAAIISSGAGEVSASADLNCLSKDLDSGLALFVDMLRNPGFDQSRLKLAKSQMLQSLERRNDSTASIERREFQRLLRGEKHFTTLQVTKASLEAISREDLIAFHDRFYYPANFVLAVSGDFDTSQMLAKLEKTFAGWPNRDAAIPDPPKPEFTPKPGVYIVNKKDVNQGRVRMGHVGVDIANPDHLALAVMNGILGGDGFTSHIMARVRTEEGLAYSAQSSFLAGTYYEGVFAAGFQSKSPSVAQAIAIVIEEIKRLQDTKVGADELAIAINRAVETLPLRFASAGGMAGQFAGDYFSRLPEDYWQKYRQRVSAITPEEIQRVAKKYLHPKDLVVLAVGDADAIMRGNPDRPQYSIAGVAGGGAVVRIPLPDPLSMVYPVN